MSWTMGNPFNVAEKEDFADISLFEFPSFVPLHVMDDTLFLFFCTLCQTH